MEALHLYIHKSSFSEAELFSLQVQGVAYAVWEMDNFKLLQAEYPCVLTKSAQAARKLSELGIFTVGVGDSEFSGLMLIYEKIDDVNIVYLDMMRHHYYNMPYEIARKNDMILRESVTEDFDALYEIFEEEHVRMFPHTELSDRSGENEKFKRYIQASYRFYGCGFWTVLIRVQNIYRIAGWVGFYPGENGGFCLGYIVKREFRRKGIAYRACRYALEFANDVLELDRILLEVEIGNQPSRSLAEKMGFYSLSKTVMEIRLG